MHAHLIPFIGVAWLILVTPGVDMALVTRNALSNGRSAAVATALGVNLGVTVWVVAAAVGLAAVVQASATLFTVIKLAGAAYLFALGLRAIIASYLGEQDDSAQGHGHSRSPFRQGVTSNLLNPKMAVLFTSLLPQFVDRAGNPLPALVLLGLVFNVLGLIWLVGFALAVARSRAALARPAVRRWQQRVTGTVLVGLGIRVALERR